MRDPSTPQLINPRWTTEVRTRLSPLKLSPTRESEIVQELSQHLEEHFQELLARVDPVVALRAEGG